MFPSSAKSLFCSGDGSIKHDSSAVFQGSSGKELMFVVLHFMTEFGYVNAFIYSPSVALNRVKFAHHVVSIISLSTNNFSV